MASANIQMDVDIEVGFRMRAPDHKVKGFMKPTEIQRYLDLLKTDQKEIYLVNGRCEECRVTSVSVTHAESGEYTEVEVTLSPLGRRDYAEEARRRLAEEELEAWTRPTIQMIEEYSRMPEGFLVSGWDRAEGDDFHNEEDSMKRVYEGLVIQNDDKGEPVSVLQTIAPFVAGSVREAQDAILVDYAQETHKEGKDLTGIQVRVREFLGATS